MYGELLGENFTARRADITRYVTRTSLPKDSEIRNCRYVFITSQGNVWSRPLDRLLRPLPSKMLKHMMLLNVILADRFNECLVHCGGKYPIEILPGQTFSWIGDHALIGQSVRSTLPCELQGSNDRNHPTAIPGIA